MRNIVFEDYDGPRLPRQAQLRRLQRVIENELTETQRQVLLAYYFQEKTLVQIAQERGVYVSTVCRTLQRAERRIRRYLCY